MSSAPAGIAQYIERYGEQTIAGSQYALKKLGVDRANCSLKIEEYVILSVPFQLGFKKSVLLASLSKQEMAFFQKYINTKIGFSISLNPNNRPQPLKFFVRCTLNTLGQMKGRENVGLFVIEYLTPPEEMVRVLGNYIDAQEKFKLQYEDYGNKSIRVTNDAAKLMGYNMYATVTEANKEPKRVQLFNLSTKNLEHMEAFGTPLRHPGTAVSYQLFFQKFRVNINGSITRAEALPQGIIRTIANLDFSPELVEIIDEYWLNYQASLSLKTAL